MTDIQTVAVFIRNLGLVQEQIISSSLIYLCVRCSFHSPSAVNVELELLIPLLGVPWLIPRLSQAAPCLCPMFVRVAQMR